MILEIMNFKAQSSILSTWSYSPISFPCLLLPMERDAPPPHHSLLECIVHPSHRTLGDKRLWKKIEVFFFLVMSLLNWIPNNIGPKILSWSVFFQSVECFSNKVLPKACLWSEKFVRIGLYFYITHWFVVLMVLSMLVISLK